jgi:hypothetical protein
MLVTRSQNYLRSEMSWVLLSMMAVWRLQVPEQKASKNGKSTVEGIEETGSSKANLTAPCARSFVRSAIRVKRLAIGSQKLATAFTTRSTSASDVASCRRCAHRAAAAPGGAAQKCLPSLLNCSDDFISAAVVTFFRCTSGHQASKWD